MDYQPLLFAFAAFAGVYLALFFIRLFADLYLVGVAVLCGLLAYSISGFGWYADFREFLQLSGLLSLLGISLPETADFNAVAIITAMIILGGTLISIPALPFSAAYRYFSGLSRREQRMIRRLVAEELERHDGRD